MGVRWGLMRSFIGTKWSGAEGHAVSRTRGLNGSTAAVGCRSHDVPPALWSRPALGCVQAGPGLKWRSPSRSEPLALRRRLCRRRMLAHAYERVLTALLVADVAWAGVVVTIVAHDLRRRAPPPPRPSPLMDPSRSDQRGWRPPGPSTCVGLVSFASQKFDAHKCAPLEHFDFSRAARLQAGGPMLPSSATLRPRA